MKMSGDGVGQMLSIQITGSRFNVQVFGLSLRITSCKEIFFDADKCDWAVFTQGTQDLFLLQPLDAWGKARGFPNKWVGIPYIPSKFHNH